MATVLIAEDDKDIVELLRLYISGSGYDVLVSSDGKQALELAREQHVDIALVDIMMPRMNGYDFIKAQPPRKRHPRHHHLGALATRR